MDAFYCGTKEEAKELILSMIPEGASVTWGGCESMKEAGVCDAIQEGNYDFIDRKTAKLRRKPEHFMEKLSVPIIFLPEPTPSQRKENW